MTDRHEHLMKAFLDDLGSAPVPTGLARRVSGRIQGEHPVRASRFGAWFLPVAAALAILALVGFAVIVGGPKPSPSVQPVPPSASALATPAPSPSSTPVTPPTVAPDQSVVPTPSASIPAFHITLDPGGNPLPVMVSDASSTVTGAAPVRPNLSTNDPVEVVQGSAPNDVVVAWVGGGCDQLSQVTLDAARTTVSVSTLTTSQGCDAIGIERAVALTFGQPVAAASIRGQWGPPLSPHMMALDPSAVSSTDANHGFVAGHDAFTGLAYLAETNNGGTSWNDMPVGWGTVTGAAVTVDATVRAYPIVAISCSAGRPYARPGLRAGHLPGAGADLEAPERWGTGRARGAGQRHRRADRRANAA